MCLLRWADSENLFLHCWHKHMAYLHCVSSCVSLDHQIQRTSSCIAYKYRTFLYCVHLCVLRWADPENLFLHRFGLQPIWTSVCFFPLWIWVWGFRLLDWVKILSHWLHFFHCGSGYVSSGDQIEWNSCHITYNHKVSFHCGSACVSSGYKI